MNTIEARAKAILEERIAREQREVSALIQTVVTDAHQSFDIFAKEMNTALAVNDFGTLLYRVAQAIQKYRESLGGRRLDETFRRIEDIRRNLT